MDGPELDSLTDFQVRVHDTIVRKRLLESKYLVFLQWIDMSLGKRHVRTISTTNILNVQHSNIQIV